MWKITLGPGTAPVTDFDNSLIAGNLKEAYDSAVNWFDKQGQLPKKPEGIETEEWFKDHFPAELAKIVSKEATPQNRKSAGSVTLAIFDKEASTILRELGISGMITKLTPNRHSRKTNNSLERRLAKHD